MKRLFLVFVFLLGARILASDYNDDLGFQSKSPVDRSADLLDLYLFKSPTSAENTVLILTTSPFSNVFTPVFFDSRLAFEFKIDQDGDNLADLTFRITFGVPGPDNTQQVILSEKGVGRASKILLRTVTRAKQKIGEHGYFQAGIFDDPSFFDRGAFDAVAAKKDGATFPRGEEGVNHFGPEANCLAIVLEVPTTLLTRGKSWPIIGVWARALRDGKQIDRIGRPFTGLFFLPPLPYDNNLRAARLLFNASRPDQDKKRYRSAAIGVLKRFWNVEEERAGALLDDFVFPDILKFDTSQLYFQVPGYPNGRLLSDDVADIVLNRIQGALTLGGEKVTADGVSDDNDGITDGRAGGAPQFPYLGKAHDMPTGPAGTIP